MVPFSAIRAEPLNRLNLLAESKYSSIFCASESFDCCAIETKKPVINIKMNTNILQGFMAGFIYFAHFIFSWYLQVLENINAIFNKKVASVSPDDWQCVRYNNIISDRPVTKN